MEVLTLGFAVPLPSLSLLRFLVLSTPLRLADSFPCADLADYAACSTPHACLLQHGLYLRAGPRCAWTWQVVVSNLVDSNVFLRAVILSL